MARPRRASWTIEELREDLVSFERELVAGNLKPSTFDTYMASSATFLRWLDGKYEPTGPNA